MTRQLAILLALILAMTATAGTAMADEDEKAKICAEAAERYAEMAGDLPPEDGVVVVLMYKYTFCPPDLEVPAGSVLRWVNVDKRTSHSVWFKDSGGAESERLFPEELVEMTLTEPGAYDYMCGPHGEQEGMRGRVTVTP